MRDSIINIFINKNNLKITIVFNTMIPNEYSLMYLSIFCIIDKCFSKEHLTLFFSILSFTSSFLGYIYYPKDMISINSTWWICEKIIEFNFSFFIYEIYMSLHYKLGGVYILHGLISSLTIYICYYGFCQKYLLFFLTYEFTNIFLSSRKIINPNNKLLLNVNNFLFFVFFFIIRIIFGTYMYINLLTCLINNYKNSTNLLESKYNITIYNSHNFKINQNIFGSVIFVLTSSCLTILNYYWFYTILKILKKKLKIK
jgi:hypothetical protein